MSRAVRTGREGGSSPGWVAVIDYGAGNLRSVEFALERLRVPHRRVSRPEDLEGAARVILPGVGAARSAMRELERRGLAGALRGSGVPLLGICLGMQLLAERSEEDGGVPCLGLLPGHVRRFPAGLRVPQIGWNEVDARGDPLFRGVEARPHFYFLHSYRMTCPPETAVATAEYGGPFAAAVRAGIRAGVQFHPEKSGPAGLRVLTNFCRGYGPW